MRAVRIPSSHSRSLTLAIVLACVFVAGRVSAQAPPAPAADVPLRYVAAGDVADTSAVLLFQAPGPGDYTVEVAEDFAFRRIVQRRPAGAGESAGYIGQVEASGLRPATRYYYRAVAAGGGDVIGPGAFQTAPSSRDGRSLRLLFGADLGGQGYGRIRPGTGLPYDGFHIFRTMAAEQADLFVAVGDMIYSDAPIGARAPDDEFPRDNDYQIPKPGPGYVTDVPGFRRDWAYHRADHHLQRFLATTPYLATWDDHELVNDGGGKELVLGPNPDELARDPRLRDADPSKPPVFMNGRLFLAARQVMLEVNPIPVLRDPDPTFERRLYRSVRWGRHAELFILDTRSYRDPKYRFDTAEKPKSMLGPEQKAWLEEALAKSDATWKLIVSSVPLSIASGNIRDPQKRNYRDGWANVEEDNPYGYERELVELAAFLKAQNLRNVVFLTGDRHFSTLLSYDHDRDGVVDFHEANIGALRAGRGIGETIDPTLNPKVLFTDAPQGRFVYGLLTIEGASGRLVVEVRQVDGTPMKGARMVIDPR